MSGGLRRAAPPQPLPKSYGKYRGVVTDNSDPLMLGRIVAVCPAISDGPLTWALPCVPWGGPQTGMFIVPPVGAGVWIEFEQGDIDYPIWAGCFWSDPVEVPLLSAALDDQPGVAIANDLQTGIVLGAGPTGTGSITLQSADASIEISAQGILISAGATSIELELDVITITNGVASIVIAGPSVTVNDGALEVT
jgi:hypothetical protein